MNDKYNFQKLTPTNSANLKIYKNALDFVFENSDIKNVGITGAYSAGKSSIIETYKQSKPDIKFMHISLAHFQPTDADLQQPTEKSENILEGKILNQLIHQIKSENIPQTNFRVKRQLSSKGLWWLTAIVVVFIILFMYLFNFEKWNAFITSITSEWINGLLLWTTFPLSRLIAGMVCIGIITYLIYKIFKVQFNKNIFKGISVQGNTIEIFEQSDESYFDKYLNEVLYLFENSGKDVIVFEDMDRYNTNQIFQRLREINTLINNRKDNSDKPLRFFYLLKDDIFVSKDRTKFFDFVMPVIPVLDGSNSFDQFIAHFKNGNIYNLFNEQFLQEISLYIDDMRILKNIYNEFIVYYGTISTTEQDPNKLLAMIIYKNIFPRDFSELQLNSGFVYTLFDKKDEFINDEIISLENSIEQLQTALQDADDEHLQEKEEVNTIYDLKIRSLQRTYYNPDKLSALQNEKAIRLSNIENKTAERQDELKKKIATAEHSVIELKHKKLHEIINKSNIDKIFKITYINEIGEKSDFNDIKGSDYFPLIKYLIKNGYIDETYPDYMTYFYEHSLSRDDKTFWRSVVDENAKDYNYKLKEPHKLLSRLSDVSFEKEEILNFDLLAYLLDNQTTANKSRIIKILQQLKNAKNFSFIKLYFESGKPIGKFVQALNNVWSLGFSEILNESNFTETQLEQYALESVYHTNLEDLDAVNTDNALSNFISARKDFLNIPSPDIQRIIEVFNVINVKFEYIDYECSNKDLFQAVYHNNCYAINYELVCLMLNQIYGCLEEDDLKHKNYTTILSRSNEPLVEYVRENINDYMNVVLENCDEHIADSGETVISVLNDDTLDEELKIAYIEYLTTQIYNLQEINDVTLWKRLLDGGLVVYSEKNVLQYFFRNDNNFDETLALFINQKGDSFNFYAKEISDEFGEGSGSKFFTAVVTSKELNLESYTDILKSFGMYYSYFEITGISDHKIDVLINLKIIRMETDTLLFMREHYSQMVIRFIVNNIRLYVENVMSEETFEFDEMYHILETDVNDEYKLTLLGYTREPISIVDSNYSERVQAYILKNNLDNKDLPHLLRTYSSLAEPLQLIMDDIVKNNIDDIISNEYPIGIQLCRKIFAMSTVNDETKLQIFAISVDSFSEAECKECLDILNRKDILSAFQGKRPTIPITDINKCILDILVKKHWIVGYSIDKKDENMYRISSRRVFKQKPLPVEILD